MLFYTGLLALVIAVSLDGFTVGVTYGMRKIHVPLLALAIIMLCSGFIVLLSMTIGNLLTNFITPQFTTTLGGVILFMLGVFALFQVKRQGKQRTMPKEKPPLHKVLMTPKHADLDRSGVITLDEALLLGIALALDAFGAGLGASMLGYAPMLTTLLVASMSGCFVF